MRTGLPVLVLLVLLVLLVDTATAQGPLEPLDTSSPRATFKSFLDASEAVARRYREYRDAPGRATQAALARAVLKARGLLNLSEIPPPSRRVKGDETFAFLWEVLARLDLPEPRQVPVEVQGRWRIPGTEITIARVETGTKTGEFLFSPETVRRAREFYAATRDLPYKRALPIKNLSAVTLQVTGWMIPGTWIQALPDWMQTVVLGQVLWKWLAVLLLLALAALAARLVIRWSGRKPKDGKVRPYVRRAGAPVTVVVLGLLLGYVFEEQVNVTGLAASVPTYVLEAAIGLATIWLVWMTVNRVAEGIIASPKIAPRSLDAHLLRLAANCVGGLLAIVLGFRFASRLGLPMYGLVAGAGVGGLAIALAAKNALEDFLGALQLFADRPVRVGDLVRFDNVDASGWRPVGRVESIGLRSTKIRDFHRNRITVPNSVFAQRQITNLSACDRMLFAVTLNLRYETTDDQLRFVLAELRTLLHAHPKTLQIKADAIRVRFLGFGESSLDLEARAYIRTTNRAEFLGIQEDILLRFMAVVKRAGTGFAFPSRTLYHTRDGGIDEERQQQAETEVREWTAAHTLPFPDFTDDHRREITNTLKYPPEGSAQET